MRPTLLGGFLAFVICLGSMDAAVPLFDARRDYDTYGCLPAQFGVLTIADLNNDGIPDVVCDTVLLGNGNGTFRVGSTLPRTNFYDQFGNYIAFDVNHDGNVDILFPAWVVSSNLLAVGVMFGQGDGTFATPFFYLSSVNDRAIDDFGVPLVSGDFNGDGILDVAVLGTSEIVLFLGSPAGTLIAQPPINLTYTASESSDALMSVDVNGDGRLDLVVDVTDAIWVFPGNGDGTFRAPIITPTAARAGYGGMAVADLNGDGIPDVALEPGGRSEVLIYAGKGNGTFGPPKSVSLPGGNAGLVVADINGDGIPDLLNAGVDIAFGEGQGNFRAAVSYAVNDNGVPFYVGVADLRNNGRLDVLGGGEGISVLLNNGKGKLEDGVRTSVAGGYVACSAAGDFNGDGIPDLAIGNNNAIEIYLGTGRAIAPFKAGATYSVAAVDCPVAGDLNKDGVIDLLLPTGYLNQPGSVIAFLGNGDGTFSAGPSSSVPSVGYFALADFNGDGILDYATTTNLLALGKGDGSFGPPNGYETDNVPLFAITAGDLNGDGKADIVLTEYFSNTVYILLSTPTGGFQQTTKKACGFPGYVAFGDLNSDGRVDIAVGCDVGVDLYLNEGAGNFSNHIKLAVPTELSSITGIPVIADVNGDGIADVCDSTGSSVSVFLGLGSGHFAPPFYLGTGNFASGLYALNTQGQNPNRGTPDFVAPDTEGFIYTLLNETK